jgi:hypothetical protein
MNNKKDLNILEFLAFSGPTVPIVLSRVSSTLPYPCQWLSTPVFHDFSPLPHVEPTTLPPLLTSTIKIEVVCFSYRITPCHKAQRNINIHLCGMKSVSLWTR